MHPYQTGDCLHTLVSPYSRNSFRRPAADFSRVIRLAPSPWPRLPRLASSARTFPGDLEFRLVAANCASRLAAKSACGLANLSATLLPRLLVVRSSFQFLQDPIAQDELLEESNSRFDPSTVYFDLERAMPSSFIEPRTPRSEEHTSE